MCNMMLLLQLLLSVYDMLIDFLSPQNENESVVLLFWPWLIEVKTNQLFVSGKTFTWLSLFIKHWWKRMLVSETPKNDFVLSLLQFNSESRLRWAMYLRNRYFIGLVLLVFTSSHVVVRQSDASKRHVDDDPSLLVETTAGMVLHAVGKYSYLLL